jgi:hypothetical protein
MKKQNKTGGGIGTNQYKIKGVSVAKAGEKGSIKGGRNVNKLQRENKSQIITDPEIYLSTIKSAVTKTLKKRGLFTKNHIDEIDDYTQDLALKFYKKFEKGKVSKSYIYRFAEIDLITNNTSFNKKEILAYNYYLKRLKEIKKTGEKLTESQVEQIKKEAIEKYSYSYNYGNIKVRGDFIQIGKNYNDQRYARGSYWHEGDDEISIEDFSSKNSFFEDGSKEDIDPKLKDFPTNDKPYGMGSKLNISPSEKCEYYEKLCEMYEIEPKELSPYADMDNRKFFGVEKGDNLQNDNLEKAISDLKKGINTTRTERLKEIFYISNKSDSEKIVRMFEHVKPSAGTVLQFIMSNNRKTYK